MAIVLQAQLLLDPGNQIAHLADFTNLVHETEYLISAPFLQADTRFTFLGYFDIALTRPPLNVPMAQTEVPATISDVPMPAMAQPPSTYPYADNDRLNWDYLNWGFEFNADGVPPHGSKGGAGYFNQWIDTSDSSAPTLRQCIVSLPNRATAGVYVPAEWITIGHFDIPNRNFFFNGTDVGFVNGLSVYGDLWVSGNIAFGGSGGATNISNNLFVDGWIETTGSEAGYYFDDRTLDPTTHWWVWYANNDIAYLQFNESGNKFWIDTAGNINCPGQLTASTIVNTTGYRLSGVAFAGRQVDGHHVIYDYTGAPSMFFSGSSNIYRSANHEFQNKDGSGTGNLSVGYISVYGNVTLNGTAQLSVNGNTYLSYVNISGNVALTGSAALSVAGTSTLAAVNASGNVTTTGTAILTAGGSAGFSVSTGNTTLRATTVNGTTALNGSVSIQGNTTCLGVSQLTVGGLVVFQQALTVNGTIYYGALSALSDAFVKSEIAPYTVGLDAIKQLDPVSFKYIPALRMTSDTKYGLMADDVRPVIPEMVGETEIEIDGVSQTVATISPDHLWYVLINATKELAARVEALEVAR